MPFQMVVLKYSSRCFLNAARIAGFSANVQDVLAKFDFDNIIKRMVECNSLYLVIKEFASPKGYLGPDKISAVDCGYIFEDLVKRFSARVRKPSITASFFTFSYCSCTAAWVGSRQSWNRFTTVMGRITRPYSWPQVPGMRSGKSIGSTRCPLSKQRLVATVRSAI